MATQVLLNVEVRLHAVFKDESTGSFIDPADVEVLILEDDKSTVIFNGVATRESLGVYYYDWTPDTVGSFYVQFIATFGDGEIVTIEDEYYVYAESTKHSTDLLGEDVIVHFVGESTPLYADPEEISTLYPDPSLAEILEQIHKYSQEVVSIIGAQKPLEELPFIVGEYVRVATLCNLSNIYDIAFTGDESSLSLGDLSITNRGSSRGTISRGAASSWCELAAALRAELLRSVGGMTKGVIKGKRVYNPLPSRSLRDPYTQGRRQSRHDLW